MRIPRLLVAAPWTGSGKTLVTLALLAALRGAGLKVQPFKVGPDFIDPSYHAALTGRPSVNLDTWLLSRALVLREFARAARDADIAVVEGVMGLFDGLDARGARGTAELARLLRLPIVLVVDVDAMAASVAAVVKGVKALAPRGFLAGVILNKVAGPGHARACREAIEAKAHVPTLGAVPRDARFALPERHLGLVPMAEARHRLRPLARLAAEHLNLDALLAVARRALPLPSPRRRPEPPGPASRVRIGIAQDEAFHFYYATGLHALQAAGAELVPFSPVRARRLPRVDGLYLGGGFPEVFARALERNGAMRRALAEAAGGGLPIYAECGGLMYLCEGIDVGREGFEMVGVFPARARMGPRLTIGYVEGWALAATPLLRRGDRFRGHEFHQSVLVGVPSRARLAHGLVRGRGIRDGRDGWLRGSALGSYTHIHFAALPHAAERWVTACRAAARVRARA